MTRILFLGDMAATGFGTVTSDLGRGLLDIGHDVRFLSQNEVDDLPEPFASRTFKLSKEAVHLAEAAAQSGDPERIAVSWQALKDVMSVMEGGAWPDGWQAEAALVLGDYWGVSEVVLRSRETIEGFKRIPTFHYVPIEGVDLPPSWKRLWDVVYPVAMSEFGAAQIEKVVGYQPPVVYHGVDTTTFRPFDSHPYTVRGKKLRSREDARKLLGIPPEVRLILRTDRQMVRKRYPSLLRAIAPVMATRPDVFLMMHCDPIDLGGHLRDQTSKYPDFIASRMLLSNGAKVEREMLATLYNAADVYASPSAEGFGLTIAEAMACGVPAVGMDYSSVTEVVGPGGLLAPVNHLVDNEYDHAWAAVDEAEFGKQVAKLLDDPFLRKSIGRQARAHVVDKFSWAKAAIQFSAIIRERTAMEAVAA